MFTQIWSHKTTKVLMWQRRNSFTSEKCTFCPNIKGPVWDINWSCHEFYHFNNLLELRSRVDFKSSPKYESTLLEQYTGWFCRRGCWSASLRLERQRICIPGHIYLMTHGGGGVIHSPRYAVTLWRYCLSLSFIYITLQRSMAFFIFPIIPFVYHVQNMDIAAKMIRISFDSS